MKSLVKRKSLKRMPKPSFLSGKLDLFVLIVAFLIFGSMQVLGVKGDASVQVQILFKLLGVGSFPIPPGFYALVALFYGLLHGLGLRGFLGDEFTLGLIVAFISGVAWFTKYHVTKQTLRAVVDKATVPPLTIGIITVSLLFTAPIFYDVSMHHFYLGRVATHAWQNPTSILVMPFVLLLFNESLCFFKTDKVEKKNILVMLAWGILILLIKPSFLFAFIPSLSLLSFMRFGILSKKARMAVLVSAVIFVGVLLEAYLIYYLELFNIWYVGDEGGVVLAPFRFLSSFGGNVLLNLFVSLLFPLLYLVLTPRDIKERVEVQMAFITFSFALLIGVLFEETGAKANHGNFMWQAMMANFVLFCVVAARSFLYEAKGKFEKRRKNVLFIVYSLHVISGIAYITKYLVTGLYY